jgi:hypothetical protein
MGRIDKFLSNNFKKEELLNGSFYLASNSRQQLIEEIVDVYIGYVYDKEIKMKIIGEMVMEVWNDHSEG